MLSLGCIVLDLSVTAHGIFHHGTWDLIPQAGIKPRPSPLGEWGLSHWSIKEIPVASFFEEIRQNEALIL